MGYSPWGLQEANMTAAWHETVKGPEIMGWCRNVGLKGVQIQNIYS